MRLTTLLPSLLLPFVSATPSSETYHSALKSSYPIKLSDATYAPYTGASRDFSTVVLLTAMDARFGCGACREFQPEWDVLARSWQKGDKKGESGTVFTTLDFSDGRNTFGSLGLSHAPVIMLYLPTTGVGAKPDGQPLRFDFNGGMSTADTLHNWLSRHLPEGPRPPVVRPFNWTKAIFITTSVVGVITFLAVAAPYAAPILQNRNVWAAISLLLVLLFTSGHMFNHIRKVPYVAGDGKGGVSYFAGGFQSQYGMETQIIAAIYGILSFAAINLAVKVPRIVDPKAQQVAALAWGAALWMVYSFLLSIFRMKNQGYPFYLPPM